MPYPSFFAGQRLTADLMYKSQPLYIEKQAQQSIANNTNFQPDAELRVTLLPGVTYEISGVLFYSADANCDIKLQPSGGLAASVGMQVLGLPPGSTGTSGPVSLVRTGSTNTLVLGGAAAGSNTQILAAQYRGLVRIPSGGEFVWQWAQNTAGAVATIMRSGSYMRVEAAF